MLSKIVRLLCVIIFSLSNISYAQIKSISGQLINGKGNSQRLDHIRVSIKLNNKIIGNVITDDFGYFNYQLASVNTINNSTPAQFQLNENYPNPFHLNTKISYTLKKSGQVKLDIFNVLGQKVKSLVNHYQTDGTYLKIWDGTNDSGNLCSRGTYIYRINFDGNVKFKKMCVLDIPNLKNNQLNKTISKTFQKSINTNDILEIKIINRNVADTTAIFEFSDLPENIDLGTIHVHVYPFLKIAADTISLMSGENTTDTLNVYYEKPIQVSSPHLALDWHYLNDSLITVTYYNVDVSDTYIKFNEINNPKSIYANIYFDLSDRLMINKFRKLRSYIGIDLDRNIKLENTQGDGSINLLTILPQELIFNDGNFSGTPNDLYAGNLYFELLDAREILTNDSLPLIIREPVNIHFNEYSIEISEEYPRDGTHTYSWIDTYTGVTRDLYYKNIRIARANPNGSKSCFCCGLTFEDFFRSIMRLNNDLDARKSVNAMSVEDMIYFINLWFVEYTWGDGPGIAMESFGIGDRITDKKLVKEGDYLQFWRTTGSGHSVIFINWVESAVGDTIGIRYWSTQTSTNGINYNIEYYDGCGGRVDPDILFFSRIRSPENFTSFNRKQLHNYNTIVNSKKPITPKAFMEN